MVPAGVISVPALLRRVTDQSIWVLPQTPEVVAAKAVLPVFRLRPPPEGEIWMRAWIALLSEMGAKLTGTLAGETPPGLVTETLTVAEPELMSPALTQVEAAVVAATLRPVPEADQLKDGLEALTVAVTMLPA